MKNIKVILYLLSIVLLASCTEEIVIDLEEGSPMIGIDASITDEMKHHEVILSYSADFYNSTDIHMISNAVVLVTDGVDTIPFYECDTMAGHYFSPLMAGTKNRLYRLQVAIPDNSEPDGYQHLFAESYMCDNVESMDSIRVSMFNGPTDTIPTVLFRDTLEYLYPYFQSLPDMSIVYMPMVYKNDTLLTDVLTNRMLIPQGGYAGYYVNGPEMLEANKEIPIYLFMRSKLKDGDRFKAELYSVPMDYMYYLYSISASMGSNPMMGAPTNLITNIQPEGKGVGWFYAASIVSAETVYHK